MKIFSLVALPLALVTFFIIFAITMIQPLGELIKDEVERQERSVTWFAGKIGLDRSNVYRLFKKNSVDTSLLMRISMVLNRDFFAILSDEMRERQNLPQK